MGVYDLHHGRRHVRSQRSRDDSSGGGQYLHAAVSYTHLVATALALGGPGAIFWMWISGLFGMVIKSAEITLAVHYRSKDEDDTAYGGPNYYIKKGIGQELNLKALFKVLSCLFAVGFSLSYFIDVYKRQEHMIRKIIF